MEGIIDLTSQSIDQHTIDTKILARLECLFSDVIKALLDESEERTKLKQHIEV